MKACFWHGTGTLKRYSSGLLFALVLLAAAPASADGLKGKLCWSPEVLRVRSGENQIRKKLRQAYVPLPERQPTALPSLPPHLRGIIRRVNLPPNDRRVALTFDLCEQPYEISGYQGGIVDYLRTNNVAATFFAGGKWLLTHTDRAQQLMADPRFEIANHSWEHRNHRLLSGVQLAQAIDGAQAAYELTWQRLKASSCVRPGLTNAANEPPAYRSVANVQRLYRFPFGACNPAARQAVNDRGLVIVQWDVSSADPTRGLTAKAMAASVVSRVRPGSILLFHANGRGWQTDAAIPMIVTRLRAKGYTFDTVTGLLATKGAKPEVVSTCYDRRPGDSERYDQLGRRLLKQYDAYYRSIGIKR